MKHCKWLCACCWRHNSRFHSEQHIANLWHYHYVPYNVNSLYRHSFRQYDQMSEWGNYEVVHSTIMLIVSSMFIFMLLNANICMHSVEDRTARPAAEFLDVNCYLLPLRFLHLFVAYSLPLIYCNLSVVKLLIASATSSDHEQRWVHKPVQEGSVKVRKWSSASLTVSKSAHCLYNFVIFTLSNIVCFSVFCSAEWVHIRLIWSEATGVISLSPTDEWTGWTY